MSTVWTETPPTEPGFYFIRYVEETSPPSKPTIMQVYTSGRAWVFGTEKTFYYIQGHWCEYGPKIEPPDEKKEYYDY